MKKGAALVAVLAGGWWLWRGAREPAPLAYPDPPVSLTSEVAHTGEHLGFPTGLALRGDTLLVLDQRGDKSVHVLDTRAGRLLGSVGNPGEGPAEFMVPIAASFDRAGRSWVLDFGTLRMTRLDLAELDHPTAWADSMFQLRNTPPLIDGVWLADGSLLAGGIFSESRFGVFSPDGTLRSQRDPLPRPPGYERVPGSALQQVYYAQLAASPDLSRYAAAAAWFGRIDIYGVDGSLVARASAPLQFEPSFVLDPRDEHPSAAISDDSRRAYVDVATTPERIYALFSGRTWEDFPGHSSYARDVHVFDWSGAFVMVLRLDRAVLSIAVDDERGLLFAAQHDPVPAILRFDLPAELRRPTGVPHLPSPPVEGSATSS